MHSHNAYYYPVLHFHPYETVSSIDSGYGGYPHRHILAGNTTVDLGSDVDNHVHFFEGVTTFDDGHVHRYRGVTGGPIPIPGGEHYHIFSGVTSFDDGHSHSYYGKTGPGI